MTEQRIHAASLRGFTTTADSIELPNDVIIRRLRKSEKPINKPAKSLSLRMPLGGRSSDLSACPSPFPAAPTYLMPPVAGDTPKHERFFLVTPCRTAEVDWDESKRIGRLFQETKIALQLLSGREVVLGPIYVVPPFDPKPPVKFLNFEIPSFTWTLPEADIFGTESPALGIEKAQVRNLKRLAKRLDEIRNLDGGIERRLRLAGDRFELTFSRYSEEDKLLDTWIGLEALFSPRNEGEISYRLALRTAYYIGQSGEERCKIYSTLKKSYDLRSGIVHGRAVKLQDDTVIEETRGYLRQALQKALLVNNFNPDKLEDAIARGTGRKRS